MLFKTDYLKTWENISKKIKKGNFSRASGLFAKLFEHLTNNKDKIINSGISKEICDELLLWIYNVNSAKLMKKNPESFLDDLGNHHELIVKMILASA